MRLAGQDHLGQQTDPCFTPVDSIRQRLPQLCCGSLADPPALVAPSACVDEQLRQALRLERHA